jgi:methylglyoxal synthase
MKSRKTIALVAHDNRKRDLIEWVEYNVELLLDHALTCTGTTGRLVEEAIRAKVPASRIPAGFAIRKLKSGPLGGDQQLGALITEGEIDVVIFFWDPMEPQPHDVDVKALLRIAVVYNIPMACNRSTADFLISSPLMGEAYEAKLKDYSVYLTRQLGLD